MSEADDLLREASDPTTPGERLAELWGEGFSDDNGSPARWLLVAAVMRNPSTPLDLLEDRLLMGSRDVWYNPAASLLIQRGPRCEFERAAHDSLSRLVTDEWSRPRDVGGSLREAVSLRAVTPPGEDDESRDFARHLAGLFGLPWPEP